MGSNEFNRPAHALKPLKMGQLVAMEPPGHVATNKQKALIQEKKHLVLILSPLDEMSWWKGADPKESFLEQVQSGPHNWYMFISCVSFAVPAFIHLYFHTIPDFLAAFGLLAVSISSPLCDSICIYYADFDNALAGYERTEVATGIPISEIKAMIEEHDACEEIRCTDNWNNLTRLMDRATCVVLTAPTLLYYMFMVRPGLARNWPFFLLFAIGMGFAQVGQKLRGADPCGFSVVHREYPFNFFHGRRHLNRDYEIYELFHIIWHFCLFVAFVANAIYRPSLFPYLLRG
jgi:hypothetical protein